MARLGFLDVDEFVNHSVNFEQVRIGLLAYFTFKLLPVHAGQAISFFLLHFSRQPILQTVVVDEPDRT